MENKLSTKNQILNYGLILGAAGIIVQLIQYSLGQHLKPHWAFSVLSTVLSIAIIVIAIKNLKKANNDILSFGQAIKLGMSISLISAILYILYSTLIFTNFIEPEYWSQLWAIEEEKMFDRGMTEEQIKGSMNMVKNWGIYITYAFIIIVSVFIGFVISAISGAIMKNDGIEA